MAAVRPGHHDPVGHLQRSVSVPVLLPALHPHQGGPVLHHRGLPDPGWSVRDERSVHLHGQAPGLALRLGELLRLRLHPGVGGLPAGAPQRRRLRDLAEAGVRRREGTSGALSARGEGGSKPGAGSNQRAAQTPNANQTKQKAAGGS